MENKKYSKYNNAWFAFFIAGLVCIAMSLFSLNGTYTTQKTITSIIGLAITIYSYYRFKALK